MIIKTPQLKRISTHTLHAKMVSVKQITMSERTKVNEASMKEKVVVINEHSDNEDDVTLEERCGKSNNPKVVHKGKNSDLNFEKQYKRRVNHCVGRKLFRIHDFTKPNDHGSLDKSLVYVEFQGGLFEALKLNMIEILRNLHGIEKSGQTQVETFGISEAQERYCIDMNMTVDNHVHALKLKIYNTACALDAQGMGKELHSIFEHLQNKTVGEYFVTVVIPKVVEYINGKVNVKELNEKYLRLAREGVKATRKNKLLCSTCNVSTSGPTLKCKYCKRSTHEKCARKFHSESSVMSKLNNPGTYRCNDCVIQITMNEDVEDEEEVENVESVEKVELEMLEMANVDKCASEDNNQYFQLQHL